MATSELHVNIPNRPTSTTTPPTLGVLRHNEYLTPPYSPHSTDGGQKCDALSAKRSSGDIDLVRSRSGHVSNLLGLAARQTSTSLLQVDKSRLEPIQLAQCCECECHNVMCAGERKECPKCDRHERHPCLTVEEMFLRIRLDHMHQEHVEAMKTLRLLNRQYRGPRKRRARPANKSSSSSTKRCRSSARSMEPHTPIKVVCTMDKSRSPAMRSPTITVPLSPVVRLTVEKLTEGRRVLMLNDGLFHMGRLNTELADAFLYTLKTDGRRSTNQEIICQDDLLHNAVEEKRPESINDVHVGSRVGAIWSGRLPGFYPGTVSEIDASSDTVTIEFDDGDSAITRLENVRHLPHDLPITKCSQDILPAFVVRSRRGTTEKVPANPMTPTMRRPPPPRTVDADQWQWVDEGVRDQRRIMHEAVKKGDVVIRVGDTVHLLHREPNGRKASYPSRSFSSDSLEDMDKPYVALISSMWQSARGTTLRMRVTWHYRASELPNCQHTLPDALARHALFTSKHEDDNVVETISGRCNIVDEKHFDTAETHSRRTCKLREDGALACYFIAGEYDLNTMKVTKK